MATGGSTNAVLHFLAIAHAGGVEWTIDDFERMRQKVPVLCDLKPSGKHLAVDLHRAGGIPQVMKVLLEAGHLHGDCMTITGKTIAETLAELPAAPRADQDVIRPIDRPMYAHGHLAILKGNLSTEGAVAKITGLKKPVMTGPARVFDDEPSAMAAIMDRKIVAGDVMVLRYLGPKGAPGHARDAGADRRADRPGARRIGRAWSPTGASPAAPGAWSSATSRPRPTPAERSRWCAKATRSRSTRTGCCCSSNVADAELAQRRAAWQPPAPRYTRGVLAKFARNASSASRGAVLDGD